MRQRSTRAGDIATLVGLACMMLACTTSATSLIAPAPDKCHINVSNSSSSFSASGGTGTVTVSAMPDCVWKIAADAVWIAVNGDRTGQGSAAKSYNVAPNPESTPRSGSLMVGLVSLQVSQVGAPCRFALSRSADSIVASGGPLAVDVVTVTGCAWTAATNDSWVRVTSGQSGSASGTVGLMISSNSGGRRIGHVTIAGHDFSVAQDAAAAPPPARPPPGPPSAPPPPPEPPPPVSGPPIELEGRVSSRAGVCPSLTFTVDATAVFTDSRTVFKEASCSSLANGRRVELKGVRQANGAVWASRIEVER